MLLRSPHRASAVAIPAPRARPAARGQRLGMVLAATALAMFLVDLDFFALNLAIPKMASELRGRGRG